jgi:acyl carrier protein phosphodiesterase
LKAKLHIKIVFSTCFFVFNKHRICIFVFKIKELNYLAHQVLSFKNPNLMIGNFIADSIQGNRFDGLNEDIIKGIKLHRKIDTFTDSHPIYLTSKHRFSKDFGKYSGVLMDMIYDHYLAKNFDNYSEIKLQDFCNHAYVLLQDNMHVFPEHAKRFHGYMVENNILFNYSTLEGMETVLTHLNHRIRHRYQLQNSIAMIKEQDTEIEEEFFIFFDDLHTYCLEQEEVISLL